MNIVKRIYKANTGYHDIPPTINLLSFQVHETEDGVVFYKPLDKIPSGFNEIQIEGDPDLRREYLPLGDDNVLLLDDPDYDAKFFRMQNMASKNLPLTVDDEFIRRWVALSSGTQEVIELGILSDESFYDGNGWGGIEATALKKSMLPYIENMDQTTRDSFMNIHNDAQWAADFVIWREELSGRIKFTEV